MFKVIKSRIDKLEKDLNDAVAAGGEIYEIFDSSSSNDDYLIVVQLSDGEEEETEGAEDE